MYNWHQDAPPTMVAQHYAGMHNYFDRCDLKDRTIAGYARHKHDAFCLYMETYINYFHTKHNAESAPA